ncbi:MAG: SMI1/KNR4 family protein [Deltaproteobacteria bacterium]|nr:SMI1/KNR4 family protein [Deltaproteobacteria bacterium]MDQ3300136.1 SMI1/KNR4 family protein [Myxococcota bacterium]
MTDTIELVERVRRRLTGQDNPCQIAGPAPETAISAAEEALGVTFPPSYRTFLRTWGGIAIPPHLGVVHDFVGVTPTVASSGVDAGINDVVHRTLEARQQRKLAEHLVVVGMGAQYQEWFCLDVSRPTPSGEYPVLLFDAKDNALDQQFYEDFGQMLEEVMGFVADSLDQPLD